MEENKESKKAHVYMITNYGGNVVYIGSTEDLNGRIKNVAPSFDKVSARYMEILRFAQDTFLAGRNYRKPFELHLHFPPKTK